eukprot:6796278-Prymnesium_polylepis.1
MCPGFDVSVFTRHRQEDSNSDEPSVVTRGNTSRCIKRTPMAHGASCLRPHGGVVSESDPGFRA